MPSGRRAAVRISQQNRSNKETQKMKKVLTLLGATFARLPRPGVVIEVRGGVAHIEQRPRWVEVAVIDRDAEKMGA
jgi:hypothetical protein